MNASRTVMPLPNPPFPPLPDPLPPLPDAPVPVALEPLHPLRPVLPFPQLRSLRCGCYLVNFTPTGHALVSYDGTLRVECHAGGRTASGDLYQRRLVLLPRPLPPLPIPRPRLVLEPAPNPAEGIPIFRRAQYRYYLRVTQILESPLTVASSFPLAFERWRFDLATRAWDNEGTFTAQMTWSASPAGFPSTRDFLAGDVRNAAGVVIGRLTMGWISSHLRKATIEIDRVTQAESPLTNGAGVDWTAVGNGIGWQLAVDESDSNLVEPSGESWSNAEVHAEMLARRDAANLDAEWRYHIICVRRLDATERGIMYDNGATDSNKVPREGCGISSHWVVPNTPTWGLVRGQRFGAATMPYFRTAVHETGHAMGLYHNTVDNGFMNTTDVIAATAPPATPFPTNTLWSFAADDQHRLRHMPDVYVRPGGVPFGTAYASTPISPRDLMIAAPSVDLAVEPTRRSVPIGAPVRVDLELTNTGDTPVAVPPSLSLGAGYVRGRVIDSSGATRTFSPLVLCLDREELVMLEPGRALKESLTLLRGGEGALFPSAGAYDVEVEAEWDVDGVKLQAIGRTAVMVTAAVDAHHAETARDLLSTPDTLPVLVLGGDHLTEGIAAIQRSLDDPVLRPHFAYIEAKRHARHFGARDRDLDAAAQLLDGETVMSQAEIAQASRLFESAVDSIAVRVARITLDTKKIEIGRERFAAATS